MTALRFASAVRASPSPNRGFANLELLDADGGTIAAAQLDPATAAALMGQLLDHLGPDGQAVHNAHAGRLVREMWSLTGAVSRLNVLAESILLGVGMLNFPGDPRRQALMIQEIADAAQDRAKRPGRPVPPHGSGP